METFVKRLFEPKTVPAYRKAALIKAIELCKENKKDEDEKERLK